MLPISLSTSLLDVMYSRPSFFIIGAQKCGTTSFYDYIAQHPQVLPASQKEVNFFDYRYKNGERWYRRHFPNRWKILSTAWHLKLPVLTGEATPCYFLFPHAPQRLHLMAPHAKLLVLLRNPVDRAYSHYQMNIAKQNARLVKGLPLPWQEPLSFEDALAKEDERLTEAMALLKRNPLSNGFNFRLYSYRTRGLYAQQLKRWLEYFPIEQFWFGESSQLQKQTDEVYQDALAFLGLEHWELPDYQRTNEGSYKNAMNPETRARLVESFKPYNEQLYQLLGRRFDWD